MDAYHLKVTYSVEFPKAPFLVLSFSLSSVYINDLPNCLKFTTPCLYADDTQIFSSSFDSGVLGNNINSDLKKI